MDGHSKDGKTIAAGLVKKSKNDSLSKNVGRKTEQTGRDERRKRGSDKALNREQSISKGNKKEEISQTLSLDAGSGIQPDQKLRTLVMIFRSLTQRQVQKLKDEDALEVYRKFRDGDLNWATVMENDGLNSMMYVCKRHEKKN